MKKQALPTLAQAITAFYARLVLPALTNGYTCIHPSPNDEIVALRQQFFEKFYSDRRPRKLLLGINPGRFGGGTTGINFTGPLQLTEHCGITHHLGQGSELSATFVYRVVEAMGGAAAFYNNFFIGAVSPVGYLNGGLNVNYYDDKQLMKWLTPTLDGWIEAQWRMVGQPTAVFVLGMGQNLKFVQQRNAVHGWFSHVVGLPHPRWVLQYRRKQIDFFVQQYVQALTAHDDALAATDLLQ